MAHRALFGRVAVARLAVRRAGGRGRAVGMRKVLVSVLPVVRPVAPTALEDGKAVASAGVA